MSSVAGAVLAAGSGSRMGAPKGELVVAGERLVDRAVRVLADAGCDPVLAVVRPGVTVDAARAIVNPTPELGLRSSLQAAVDAAGEVDALAVLVVDMPGIGAASVATVIAAWRPGRVAVARYAGRPGHPTVMSPALWRDALAVAAADEGARAFLRARPDLVDEVDVPGDPTDLDTAEDLARWSAAGGAASD